MRPPITTTKNDGAQPSHRKIQCNQKEVLAEHPRSRSSKSQDTSHLHHVVTPNSTDYINFDFGVLSNQQPSNGLMLKDCNLRHEQQTIGDQFEISSRITPTLNDVGAPNFHQGKNTTSAAMRITDSEVARNTGSDASKNLFINKNFDRTSNVLPLSETEPLLTNIEATVADPKRSICLNKNSASLVFTKKDPNQVGVSAGFDSNNGDSTSSRQRSSNGPRRWNSANLGQNRRLLESARYSNSGRTVLQHRRSLQLNYPISSSKDPRNTGNFSGSGQLSSDKRKQHSYSWYAPVYTALEEEFEADSRDSSPIHTLANATENTSMNEKLPLLTSPTSENTLQPNVHQKRIARTPSDGQHQHPNLLRGIGTNDHDYQHQNSTNSNHSISSLSGSVPKRKRFENFLKSLVGRKSSKEPNPAPLLPSPEIKIIPSPSESSLLSNNDKSAIDRIGTSNSSLNVVQQKLWNVVPLLKREGSSSSLKQEKVDSIVQYSGLRKCETVVALSQFSCLEPIKPLNRLRNNTPNSNVTCSRCSSFLSLAASGSRYSLNPSNNSFITVTVANLSANENASTPNAVADALFLCKLCLAEVLVSAATKIEQCGCIFCTECMKAYVEFEISEGAYEISCPDAQCSSQGIISLEEIKSLATASSLLKFERYRLNHEIELDKTRTWCPRAGCETICVVGNAPQTPSSSDAVNTITEVLCAVRCPTCNEEFCSGCKKPFHPSATCEENARRLAAEGLDDGIGIPFDNDLIKSCPMCAVPIEKDEGCAQMMCKRCKHVFCWYCLASLDDDFLLRHYDKGPCKNKLGHSRASVVWHRAQVIGIFAGFGILLLVASPLLLLAAPCIICCKCRICSGATKLDDGGTDFEETVAARPR